MRSLIMKPSSIYCFTKYIKNWPAILSEVSFRNKSSDGSKKVHQRMVVSSEEKMAPTGTVDLLSPFNVQIHPLSVDRNPAMDAALVQLMVVFEEEKMDEEEIKKMISWETKNSPSSLSIKSTLTLQGLNFYREAKNPFVLVLHLPVFSSVRVKTEDLGNVSVSEMESKSLSISTDKGGIHCKKMKCGEVNLESKQGDVLCTGVIQGNINIKTKRNGTVTGMRFQGNTINVAAENGTVDVSAIYADRSCFQTDSGNMTLENYHGNGTVLSKEGNLFVSGLDGSLRVELEKGDADIQVSRFHSLHLMSKQGNIKVNVPETLQASLELEGKQLELEKRLRVQGSIERKKDQQHISGFLGAGKGPLMMLFAPLGTISLNIQDWLSSLQLGGVIPEFSRKGEAHEPQPLGK